MRKSLAVMSLVWMIFTFITSSAQEWVKINPEFDPPRNQTISKGLFVTGTFVDGKNGWSIEYFPGRIWHTTDGGNHWKMQKDSSAVWAYDIDFTDRLHGWAVGMRISDHQPLLWRTEDGEDRWQESIIQHLLLALEFEDSLNGFAAGADVISRTSDGGKIWQESIVDSGVHFGIWDIHFPDRKHGWVAGGSGDETDVGIILKSTNGGAAWEFNASRAYAQGVYFADTLHGVVVGSNPPFFEGVVMRTEDGGENWEEMYLPSSWLNDVVFTDSSMGWVVGDFGFIWKTTDGGKTWERIESGTTADLNRIVFVENGRVGYIFGDDHTLLRYDLIDNVGEDKTSTVPMNYKLFPNYPNPFNGETRIEYELDEGAVVLLRIFDLTGKEVVTLEDGWRPSGKHGVIWNGKDKSGKVVSSGVYLCNLKSGVFNRTRKMCLIR
jgi:photosystem II stability/assembly factor-like uncharacterized protein